MSYGTTTTTLLDRFNAQFSTLQPAVEVLWPNVSGAPNDREACVRATINWGERRQVSVGETRRWRTPGVFQVQVFVPQHDGMTAAAAIADHVVTAMQGVTVSGVRLKATSVVTVGPTSRWYQMNANTPFEYDSWT